MEQNDLQKERERYLPKIRGCLIAGAAGDALGYTVEFMPDRLIQRFYGPDGITEYELIKGKARISDDTQMTLFTANGLLYGEAQSRASGSGEDPNSYIRYAYLDWLYTQDGSHKPNRIISWLAGIPELHNRRAPGMTCLSALGSGSFGTPEEPLNDSCGCGGVMRVAPIGLFYGPDRPDVSAAQIVRYGAEAAALTHGHPLGYIPAGMLALIVNRAAFTAEPLPEIVRSSLAETGRVFGGNPYWQGFEELMERAIAYAGNDAPDRENILKLGEGWVGHEALAIAVYAALRHEGDLSAGLIAAVNHDGDSDSTGAVCGNILGAALGMDGIGPKWTDELELRDTILAVADDLCARWRPGDPEWARKYIDVGL